LQSAKQVNERNCECVYVRAYTFAEACVCVRVLMPLSLLRKRVDDA